MKRITIKKMVAENFKSFLHKEFVFKGNIVTIKGRNGIGKTSTSDIAKWTLFGIGGTDVRPKNKNNEIATTDPIHTSITFDVDGKELEIEKFQKMEYTKAGIFKGNKNEFSVNGIPKTEKAFKEYVSENLMPMNDYLFFTDIMQFLKKSSDERREIISKYATSVSDDDVIAADSRFELVKDLLVDGTVKELINRCNRRIKELETEKSSIPSRIDEKEREKSNEDVAELELARNSILEKMQEIENKISDLSTKYKEYDKASDEYMKLKFELSDFERNATSELVEQKNEYLKQIDFINLEIKKLYDKEINLNSLISYAEKNIEEYKAKIEDQAKLWSKIKHREFDENNLICPYCKQEYTDDKKEQIRADFETHKASELKLAEDKGNDYKAFINGEKDSISKFSKELEEIESKLAENRQKIADFGTKMEEIKNCSIDIKNSPKYKEIESELKELETMLSEMKNIDDYRIKLNYDKSALQMELDGINRCLDKSYANVQIDERILELQNRQKEIAQLIANEQKIKDLLEDFKTAKAELISANVNKNFKFVKFLLFEKQVNGELKDVCRVLVNGVDMESGLNDSDSLLAGLDILTTFQRLNDVLVPIFLDRCESINNDRIPDTDNQLILLKVSEDKELIVE